ncbi:MAG: RNA polymerase sigma factor [Clostridia bacterium]|nr:RNA polymerase sigma factor [Clostridia bacterium]
MEDAQIIGLYNARDEAAIARTDEKYGGYCRAVARNVVRDRSDAEECVNDTYLRAWNSIPPDAPRSLRAYLGRIVRNIALDLQRRRAAKKRGGGGYDAVYEELADALPDAAASDAVGEAELRDLLNRFLASLSDDRRDVFIGRYWYFEPIAAIAEKTGFSQSKTKTLLFRTREELREFLKKEGVAV